MRRAVRILGYVGLSLVALVFVALAVVYAVSEIKFRRSYAVSPHPVPIPHDSASIAEGARFARNRFSYFTDAEIASLHRYLVARALYSLANKEAIDFTTSCERWRTAEYSPDWHQRSDRRSFTPCRPSRTFAKR